MSLTPYIKDLERNLWEENIEELCRKEKDVVRFSDIVGFLANTPLPHIWPLSGLDPEPPYSFSYKKPYKISLQLNSNSPALYLPYFCHNNDQICVKEGFFTNSYIGNPHYFAEMCFIIFKSHAFFPMPNMYQDSPTQYYLRKSGDDTGI